MACAYYVVQGGTLSVALTELECDLHLNHGYEDYLNSWEDD